MSGAASAAPLKDRHPVESLRLCSQVADLDQEDCGWLAPQLRLLKRNEITAALAAKLRFVVKPWHRILIFMAGSRTGRIDVSIVEDCHDQTPKITGPYA
jgi:hypothetical protein